MVDATPERHVVARHWSIEDDLIGAFVFSGISVGGAPKQQHRGAGRDVDPPERCPLGNGAREVAKRGLKAERFFNESRDDFGVSAETLLKILALGDEAHSVAEQARCGLSSGAQQRMQDDDALIDT